MKVWRITTGSARNGQKRREKGEHEGWGEEKEKEAHHDAQQMQGGKGKAQCNKNSWRAVRKGGSGLVTAQELRKGKKLALVTELGGGGGGGGGGG